jgi:hypothetical protein
MRILQIRIHNTAQKQHTGNCTEPEPQHCYLFSHLGLVQLSADDKGHVPEGQQSRGGAPRK